MLNDLLLRLRSLFRRKSVEVELDEELRFHFDTSRSLSSPACRLRKPNAARVWILAEWNNSRRNIAKPAA